MEYIRIRGARTHDLEREPRSAPPPADRRHWSSPDPARARSPSTRCTRKASAATSSRCPRTRGSPAIDGKARRRPDRGAVAAISIGRRRRARTRARRWARHRDLRLPRLLYARVGDPDRPDHPEQKLAAMTVSQMVDATLALRGDGSEEPKLMILAPVVVNRKGEQLGSVRRAARQGVRAGPRRRRVHEIDAVPRLAKNTSTRSRSSSTACACARTASSGCRVVRDGAVATGTGAHRVETDDRWVRRLFSAKFACPVCNYSLAEPSGGSLLQ